MTARDFWMSSGYRLLEPDPDTGRLLLTPEFLAAYLARPELLPPAGACKAERALHARVMADPTAKVSDAEIASVEDADARDNWRAFLAFRGRLMAAPSLEAAYLRFFKAGVGRTPPLFLSHLATVLLRHVMEGTGDAIRLRAAELFFRPQRASTENGAVLLADEERVEQEAQGGLGGVLGGVLAGGMPGNTGTLRDVTLEVLDESRAETWWTEHEGFGLVLDLTFGRDGAHGLARVIEAWVRHFLGVETEVRPVEAIHDEAWRWYVGLDAAATALVDRLWQGQLVPPEELARILGLWRMEVVDPKAMLPGTEGRPIWLALAMTPDRRVVLKPQNLLVGLPLRQVADRAA